MAKGRVKKKLPPFVPLTWELLNSTAYKVLTPSAGKALPYFLGKSGKALHKTGETVPPFEFTYAEALRLGFAKRTFARVIVELVDKGFVDPFQYGGLRGFCKSCNKFCCSDRWKRYGANDFIRKSWVHSEE